MHHTTSQLRSQRKKEAGNSLITQLGQSPPRVRHVANDIMNALTIEVRSILPIVKLILEHVQSKSVFCG